MPALTTLVDATLLADLPEAAEYLMNRVLVEQAQWMESWLRQLLDLPNLHGLIAGRACRLLLDSHGWQPGYQRRGAGGLSDSGVAANGRRR